MDGLTGDRGHGERAPDRPGPDSVTMDRQTPGVVDTILGWVVVRVELLLLVLIGLAIYLAVAAAIIMPVATLAAPLSPTASAILSVAALLVSTLVTALALLRIHRALRRRIAARWTEPLLPAGATRRTTESVMDEVRRLDARLDPSGPRPPDTGGDPATRS